MDGPQKLRRKAVKYETMNQQRHKKVIRRRIFYISLFLITTVAFFVVCFTLLFKVQDIKINGETKYPYAKIIELADISKGDNLYSFDTDEVTAVILKNMPYIKEITITRSLPSTVTIDIVEEGAKYFTRQNNEVYLLNSDFTVLERIVAEEYLNPDGLTELKTGDIKKCVVGNKLVFADKRKIDAIELLRDTLIKYDILDKLTFIDIQSRFDILFGYDDNRIRVYMGDTKDCEIKINFLHAIFREMYDDQRGKLDISDIKEAIFTPDE